MRAINGYQVMVLLILGSMVVPVWSMDEAVLTPTAAKVVAGEDKEFNDALGTVHAALMSGPLKSGGSHTWGATRKFLLKEGFAEPWKPAHHWLIGQGSGLGRRLPSVVNQSWNLVNMESDMHIALHGDLNILSKLYYGTPIWFKGTLLSYPARWIFRIGEE